jgi:hypothetical protein
MVQAKGVITYILEWLQMQLITVKDNESRVSLSVRALNGMGRSRATSSRCRHSAVR